MTQDQNNIPHNLPTEEEEIVVHGESVSPDIHEYTDHTETQTNTSHTSSTRSPEEPASNNRILRYALVVGFIIILFIISLGIVSFVPSIISSVSSTASAYLFGGIFSSNPSINISFDKNEVASGQPVTITWSGNTATSTGQYTLSFQCTDGVTINMASGQPIVCGTYFELGSTNGSIKITPTSKNPSQTTLLLNISFFESGSSQPKLTNSSSIIVDGPNSGVPISATSTQNNNSSYTNSANNYSSSNNSPAATTTNSNTGYYPSTGRSDLAIRLVSAGYSGPNGQVIQNSAIPAGARVIIEFEVSNVGTAPSGSWYLSGVLPTTAYNERTFTSPAEPSLRPGVSYLLTIAFDDFDPTQTQATLTINSSTDSNMANNTLVLRIASSGTNYETNYNYSNPNTCQEYYSNGEYYNNCNTSPTTYNSNGATYYTNTPSNSSTYYSNESYSTDTY